MGGVSYSKVQSPVLSVFLMLVNWCFEPSQPLWIISGLKETFVKRYIAERTNKARDKTGRTGSENGELSREIME